MDVAPLWVTFAGVPGEVRYDLPLDEHKLAVERAKDIFQHLQFTTATGRFVRIESSQIAAVSWRVEPDDTATG